MRQSSNNSQWISNCCRTKAWTLMIFKPSGGRSRVIPRKSRLATVRCGDDMWSAMGPMSRRSCRTSISRPAGRSGER